MTTAAPDLPQTGLPRTGMPRRRALGPFLRDRQGSTAVEFGVLALPFALLVFAILESSISFAAQQVMSNAANDVARLYRTGQIRQADLGSDDLRRMICDRMQYLVSSECPGLRVDLREFPTFAAAANERTRIVGGALDTSDFGFSPGTAQSRNMLRVYYEWPVVTDLLRRSMSTLDGGKTLHFASVTWQNEPYSE